MTAGQTGHLKEKFLAAFCDLGNVKAACKRAGVKRRQNVYDWRTEDADFAAAWAEAEIVATETLEAEAWRRATKGVRNEKGVYWQGAEIGREVKTEYSDTLLIFLLKARAPDKYRERVDLTHGGRIEVEDGGLSDEQRAERIASLLDRARTRAAGPADAAGADLGTATGPAD